MLRYHVWDVFTDRPFAGNPLAIVEGADALSDGQMLSLAREFNLSETIFLSAPRDPGHAARARIFFPTAEIPFAGHPTIGAALWLARERALADLVIEEEAGPVRVTIEGGAATLRAPVLPHAHTGPAEAAACARALGLDAADVGPQAPAAWAGGPAFLYVPVRGDDALDRARPAEPEWSALMKAAGVDSAFVYTPDLRARMFSPSAGIPEDPATGSACAILAAQLLASGALGEGTSRFEIRQGERMGRPSRIGMEADVAGGALREVRVTGRAVPVASGAIAVPPR